MGLLPIAPHTAYYPLLLLSATGKRLAALLVAAVPPRTVQSALGKDADKVGLDRVRGYAMRWAPFSERA